MISQKEASSIRRRLKSFVSSASAELSNIESQPVATLADAQKKAHIQGISSALLRSAEQLLDLFNFICDGTQVDALDRLLRTYELADAMFARHGSFLYRVLGPMGSRIYSQDIAWAKDRVTVNELLKPLVGKADAKTPSVREVLRDGAFVEGPGLQRTAPATNHREAVELLTRLEQVLGRPAGSLTGRLTQPTPQAATEEFTIDTTAIAGQLAEDLGDPDDLDEATVSNAVDQVIANIPGLNAALANGTARLIRII